MYVVLKDENIVFKVNGIDLVEYEDYKHDVYSLLESIHEVWNALSSQIFPGNGEKGVTLEDIAVLLGFLKKCASIFDTLPQLFFLIEMERQEAEFYEELPDEYKEFKMVYLF